MKISIHTHATLQMMLTTNLGVGRRDMVDTTDLLLPWITSRTLPYLGAYVNLPGRVLPLLTSLTTTSELWKDSVANQYVELTRGSATSQTKAKLMLRKTLGTMPERVASKHTIVASKDSRVVSAALTGASDAYLDAYSGSKHYIPLQVFEHIALSCGRLVLDGTYTRSKPRKKGDSGAQPAALIQMNRGGAVVCNSVNPKKLEWSKEVTAFPGAILGRSYQQDPKRPDDIQVGFGVFYNSWTGSPSEPDDPDDDMDEATQWRKQDTAIFRAKARAASGKAFALTGMNWVNTSKDRAAEFDLISGSSGNASSEDISGVMRKRGNEWPDLETSVMGMVYAADPMRADNGFEYAGYLSSLIGVKAASGAATRVITSSARIFMAVNRAVFKERVSVYAAGKTDADQAFDDDMAHLHTQKKAGSFYTSLVGGFHAADIQSAKKDVFFHSIKENVDAFVRVPCSVPMFDSYGRGLSLYASEVEMIDAKDLPGSGNTKCTTPGAIARLTLGTGYAIQYGDASISNTLMAAWGWTENSGDNSDSMTALCFGDASSVYPARPTIGNDRGYRAGSNRDWRYLMSSRQSGSFTPRFGVDAYSHFGCDAAMVTAASATCGIALDGSIIAIPVVEQLDFNRVAPLVGPLVGVHHNALHGLFEGDVEGDLEDWDDGDSFFTCFVGA